MTYAANWYDLTRGEQLERRSFARARRWKRSRAWCKGHGGHDYVITHHRNGTRIQSRGLGVFMIACLCGATRPVQHS